jgi:hypothetical protein
VQGLPENVYNEISIDINEDQIAPDETVLQRLRQFGERVQEIRIQSGVLRRRRELYSKARPLKHPRKLVAAVAVAPAETIARLQQEADEVICLQSPDFFFAVGEGFEDFSEVTDQMVVAALASLAPSSAPG